MLSGVVFAALADPTRRTLFELICDRQRTVSELVDAVQLTQPAVSQHLRVLRDHDLVHVEPRGRLRLYSVNPASLEALDHWLGRYRHLWSDRLDALEQHLKENPE